MWYYPIHNSTLLPIYLLIGAELFSSHRLYYTFRTTTNTIKYGIWHGSFREGLEQPRQIISAEIFNMTAVIKKC